jgi:hypothetical protein
MPLVWQPVFLQHSLKSTGFLLTSRLPARVNRQSAAPCPWAIISRGQEGWADCNRNTDTPLSTAIAGPKYDPHHKFTLLTHIMQISLWTPNLLPVHPISNYQWYIKSVILSVVLYGCRTWFLARRKTHTTSLETLSSGNSTLNLIMEAPLYSKHWMIDKVQELSDSMG